MNLTVPDAGDVRMLIAGCFDILGHGQAGGAGELGLQPFLGGPQNEKLLGQHVVFGARLSVVEHDQYVAGIDPIAFPHVELFDDAAVEMLDALAVALDPDEAVRHHSAVQRRGHRPSAKAAEENRDNRPARDGGRAHGIAHRGRAAASSGRGRHRYRRATGFLSEFGRAHGIAHGTGASFGCARGWRGCLRASSLLREFGHRGNRIGDGSLERWPLRARRHRLPDVAFHCATFFACAGAPPLTGLTDARRVNWPITSLRGPKISAFPSFRTRSLSTTPSVLGRCEMMTTVAPRILSSLMQASSAASPSESRFELGSSSTTRLGAP